MVAHRALEPLANARLQVLFLHQPHDPLPTDPDTLLDEVLVNAGTPIPVATRVERRADEHAQLTIPPRVARFRPGPPGVEPQLIAFLGRRAEGVVGSKNGGFR